MMASEHIINEKEIIDIIIENIHGTEALNNTNLRCTYQKLLNTYIVPGTNIPAEIIARMIISIAKLIAEGRMQNPPIKPKEIPVIKKRKA